jgi:hypothetical protein
MEREGGSEEKVIEKHYLAKALSSSPVEFPTPPPK